MASIPSTRSWSAEMSSKLSRQCQSALLLSAKSSCARHVSGCAIRRWRSLFVAALQAELIRKSAALLLVMTVHSGRFLLDVLKDLLTCRRRHLRRRQHAFDDRRREPGGLMFGFQNRPRRASRETERVGLLVEADEPRSNERICNFANL
jgi:hypothetical protein